MEDVFEYQIFDVERKKKVQGVDGLIELMAALNERNAYMQGRKDFEEGLITEMPPKPTTSVAEMKQKYPRAAAYLEAQSWSWSASFKKSGLGKQAMERILNGDDPDTVLEDMQNAWTAFRVAQEG